jgi:tetratricopeptide (TPR) repeat protein
MEKPICFMIMPFQTKKADTSSGLPAEIDFDLLWNKAFSPAIEQLGYYPVRADQDIGALIITEMMERLALSDLVLADITIPNGNVYYEVGIRHAAVKTGCVLLAAEKAKPLFDIDQMRQVRYPLPDGKVSDETAKEIRLALVESISKLKDGATAFFQALPGFPDKMSPVRATVFRECMEGLGNFRAAVAAVAEAPAKERPALALSLREKYGGKPAMVPFVALEILYLLRDNLVGEARWRAMVEYVEEMPKSLQELASVREQKYLAQAKLGGAAEAIGLYKELIRSLGDSSERQGLLGGRYKQLYEKARDNDPDEARRYLNKAIDHYERGMKFDLNDYYPSSNLPRLLRLRNQEGDAEQACQTAIVSMHACMRARDLNPSDPWVLPTLLGMAFDTGKIEDARRLVGEIKRADDTAPWRLEITLKDLETSLSLWPDESPFKANAASLIGILKGLAGDRA